MELADIKHKLYYQETNQTSLSKACTKTYEALNYLATNYNDDYVGLYDASFIGKYNNFNAIKYIGYIETINEMLPMLLEIQRPRAKERDLYSRITPTVTDGEQSFKNQLALFAQNYAEPRCKNIKLPQYTEEKKQEIIQKIYKVTGFKPHTPSSG